MSAIRSTRARVLSAVARLVRACGMALVVLVGLAPTHSSVAAQLADRSATGDATHGVPPVASRVAPEPFVAGDSSGWRFAIAPYIWAAGVKGTVGVAGRTAGIDVSFRKILENLDMALMLAAGIQKSRFLLGTELIYLKLSKSIGIPGPEITSVRIEQSQILLELTGRYRVVQDEALFVDAFGGLRFNSVKPKLEVVPVATFEKRKTWADPIVGGRLFADLGQRWLVQVRGDIGGFGIGSSFTWQALALLGYEISNVVSVRAGYRYLDVDYSDGGFVYDVATRGPITGVVIAF